MRLRSFGQNVQAALHFRRGENQRGLMEYSGIADKKLLVGQLAAALVAMPIDITYLEAEYQQASHVRDLSRLSWLSATEALPVRLWRKRL